MGGMGILSAFSHCSCDSKHFHHVEVEGYCISQRYSFRGGAERCPSERQTDWAIPGASGGLDYRES